jgi:hypothetical protein
MIQQNRHKYKSITKLEYKPKNSRIIGGSKKKLKIFAYIYFNLKNKISLL